MSRLRPTFALGYHGCEREVGERILEGEDFKSSEKDFDWLGPGAYFWESDPARAEQWARARTGKRAFNEPFVVGAVIDLRNCLDLTTQEGIGTLRASFGSFRAGQEAAGFAMPLNEDVKGDLQEDKLLRRRDCAVIRHLHQNIDEEYAAWSAAGSAGVVPPEPFDTVRGLFPEGEPAFEGAGILARTHTQIAVRRPECIVGVFRLRSIATLRSQED